MRLNKKLVAAGVGTALALALGGVALAYWTTTGSGTGSATNATSNGVIVLHAAFDAGLTPGASESVTYTADNAGTSSLRVGTIHAVVTTDKPGCLVSDFTVPDLASNTTVPASTLAHPVGSSSIAFADTAVNQDACKGAVVTLTLTSN